jgi:hypothetical protein
MTFDYVVKKLLTNHLKTNTNALYIMIVKSIK